MEYFRGGGEGGLEFRFCKILKGGGGGGKGGGIKNGPKKSDIFYGWPLRKSNIGSTHNVIYYNSKSIVAKWE